MNDQETPDEPETEEYLELVRLEDEFEAMCNEYDAARRAGNYKLARRLAEEVRAFARRHQETIDITDEQIDKLAAICRAHEKRRTEREIAENDLKIAERELKKLTEKHHQLLLEEPPQGRKRTEH